MIVAIFFLALALGAFINENGEEAFIFVGAAVLSTLASLTEHTYLWGHVL